MSMLLVLAVLLLIIGVIDHIDERRATEEERLNQYYRVEYKKGYAGRGHNRGFNY